MTRLTARQLNRATLARQLLLERERLTVPDAVHRVVALQAQEPASPYVALWNRIRDFDPADLDAAFVDHTVVKASLVRLTLHAVRADDYPPFQHALVNLLRASCLNDPRFTETGLTTAEADALVPELLAYASEPRTNAELQEWLATRAGEALAGLWWALRRFVPLVHAPSGGAWTHGPRPQYVTARVRPPTGDQSASVQHLVRRYLEGFGPATPRDVAQFTFLRAPVVRAALDALADTVETLEGPNGETLYDVRGGARPGDDVEAPPRLLGMWESTLLAYADRTRMVPAAYKSAVTRRNGDVLPTVLVDGRVVGVWRVVDGVLEATAFEKLPAKAWKGLAAEGAGLLDFLRDRVVDVYRRYHRWWSDLPAHEVRRLN